MPWLPILFLSSSEPVQELKLKPTGEIRSRFESRQDRDFNKNAADRRNDLLTRIRLGATATYGKEWAGEIQYQYSHNLYWSPSKNASADNSDLALLNATYAFEGGKIQFGRWRYTLNEARLIGPGNWGNVGRSYDGVRFFNDDWEAFAFRVGVAKPRPRNAKFAGVTRKVWGGKAALLYKADDTSTGNVNVWTLNYFASRPVADWRVKYEGALQAGRSGGKDLEAWALHLNVARPIDKKWTVFVEGNVASGGGSSSKTRTFDQLVPTNHDKYGITDVVGWRNMTELALGVDFKPAEDLKLSTAWRKFGLFDASDAWYLDSGSVYRIGSTNLVDPTGNSGKDLGSELSLEATWTYDKSWSFMGGIGVFSPGAFVENVLGTKDRQIWTFVQATYRF